MVVKDAKQGYAWLVAERLVHHKRTPKFAKMMKRNENRAVQLFEDFLRDDEIPLTPLNVQKKPNEDDLAVLLLWEEDQRLLNGLLSQFIMARGEDLETLMHQELKILKEEV